MSKIRILNEQLTNKIAAGEVVQQPSSLIKELVENSIDANATEIIVVIQNGGKTLCEVVDNGDGMSEDDLLLAFERYATSKIRTVDDLLEIKSLGFRGEALASIAAVSRVKAISTLKGANIGYELQIEGGNFRDIKPHSPKPGTAISVHNLFFNVPARRKFLKSKNVEYRKVIDVIRNFSLVHPRIHFILIHGTREVFNLRSQSRKERIGQVFSQEYKSNLIKLDYKRGPFELNGYIGNINLVRARRGEQFFYVNNRFVTDRLVNFAVSEGYSGLLSRGEYPFYCLNLTIPPGEVDVNVHPTKMEVKFSNQSALINTIKDAVRENLKEITAIAPDLQKFSPIDYYSQPSIKQSAQIRPDDEVRPKQTQTQFFSGKNTYEKPDDERNYTKTQHYTQQGDMERWAERAQRFTERSGIEKENQDLSNIQVYQVHKRYIISQVATGLVIIDQHVAHERILFEEAVESFSKEAWKTQQLLFPQIVELSVTDMSSLLEILPFVEKLGFRVKEFGVNTIAVEGVPAGMRWGNEESIIKDIIDYYQEYGKKDTSIQTRVAAAYACKAAIKSGDNLTAQEMQYLVERLFKTSEPYYCPHGRPIIVNLTLKELDKRFERI